MKEIREKHTIKTDGRAFIVEQDLPRRGKEKGIPINDLLSIHNNGMRIRNQCSEPTARKRVAFPIVHGAAAWHDVAAKMESNGVRATHKYGEFMNTAREPQIEDGGRYHE